MNYQRIYNQIIERAKHENRFKGGNVYYEAHHIIPLCIGGGNEKDNLVLLTSREHFICHWLLHTIYPKNLKLQLAFEMMCFAKSDRHSRYTPSSRVIEEARKTIKQRNKELGKLKVGKKYPKLSEAKKGFKFSEENRKNMSISQINMSKEKRENINKAQRNLCWITNGVIDKRYPKNKDLPSGYFRGRSFKLKKSSIEKQKKTKKLKGISIGSANPAAKTVLQYDTKGNFIKEYSTIKQAELETGISKIGLICAGTRKQHDLFIFKFKKKLI